MHPRSLSSRANILMRRGRVGNLRVGNRGQGRLPGLDRIVTTRLASMLVRCRSGSTAGLGWNGPMSEGGKPKIRFPVMRTTARNSGHHRFRTCASSDGQRASNIIPWSGLRRPR